MVAVGGGAYTNANATTVNINTSTQLGYPYWPAPEGTGWIVSMNNASASDTTFWVEAICTTPTEILTNTTSAPNRLHKP
jgi:hypothetical protein